MTPDELRAIRVAVEHERDRLGDCDHDPVFCTCNEAAEMSALLVRIDAAIAVQTGGAKQ